MTLDDNQNAESDYWQEVRRRRWKKEAEAMANRVGRGFGLIPGKTPAESRKINQRAFAKAILAISDLVPAKEVAKARATLARLS